MSPTVLRDGPFRLFFFSREEERMHVHVAHPDGEAKFWLEPTIAGGNGRWAITEGGEGSRSDCAKTRTGGP